MKKTFQFIFALTMLLISTIACTQSDPPEQELYFSKINKIVVISPAYAYTYENGTFSEPTTVEAYILAETQENGGERKKYLRLHKESSFTHTIDVNMLAGIEKSRLNQILTRIIAHGQEDFEGLVEEPTGTIDFRYKQYDNLSTISITQNNIDVITYIGNKEVTWKLLEKLQEITRL